MTEKKRVSLCIVTCNDEQYITDCLHNLKEYVDEMIIADIGSSDQTVELAGRAGADVYQFDWKKSFSDARNFCMDRAGGRWLLFLQANEFISAEYLKDLGALLKNPNVEGYLFYYDNNINAQGISSPNGRLRLIRNRKEYRYLYRAFELLPDEQISSIQNANIKIERRGGEPPWDTDMRIRLLDEDMAEHPMDQYINYMYGLKLFNEGKHEESVDYFKKACHDLNTDCVFAPHLYKCLGWSLLYLKRYPEALEVLNNGIDSFALYTDLLVLRGEVYNQLEMYRESIQDLKLCLNSMGQSMNMVPRPETNAAIVWEMLGIILEQLINFPQAILCFREAYRLDYQNTGLLSEICRLAVEEDLPEVLTDMLKIPVELKIPDQIMILAKAFFTLGEYQKTLDCISLLKCFGLPDPLLEMEYTCRIILSKDKNVLHAGGMIDNGFLLQRIQGLWLRDKMPEAENLLREMDITRDIAPSVKDLYRLMQKAFCGKVQEFQAFTPEEYDTVSSLHNTLLRNGQMAKAKALLPLLLDAQRQDHLISLALPWARHNDFHALRRIFHTISETDKREEYKGRVFKKLLDCGHVETAEKLLKLDPQQPSEEMTLAIWSARQMKKMKGMVRRMHNIGIVNGTPKKPRKKKILHNPLINLFYTVREKLGREKTEKELTYAEIHEQFGVFFEKNQKKAEALSAYLRVLQWDPLNETAIQKVNAFFSEDPGLLDGFLHDIPWHLEGGQFCKKEELANYIRGLICFSSEQYEHAFTFFSEAAADRCPAPPAYLTVILCIWDRDAEAEELLRNHGRSSETLASFCKVYQDFILYKLEEGFSRYAYSGLLLGQKESVQNGVMALTA